MATQKGRDIKIRFDTLGVGGAGANWVAIAQQVDGGDTLAQETVDASNKDTGGWASVEVIGQSWTMTISGKLAVGDPTLTAIRAACKAGTKMYFQLYGQPVGLPNEEGRASCEMTRDFPNGGLCEYSLSVTGDGALS